MDRAVFDFRALQHILSFIKKRLLLIGNHLEGIGTYVVLVEVKLRNCFIQD